MQGHMCMSYEEFLKCTHMPFVTVMDGINMPSCTSLSLYEILRNVIYFLQLLIYNM
jgi:hypothetical protein